MTYLTRSPIEPLRPFVEHIGVQESERGEGEVPNTRILPTGTIDLVFHYGDAFVRFEDYGVQPEPACHITGQRLAPMEVAATGKTGIVVVGLFPWALPALFGCDASEFRDTTRDLAQFVPALQLQELTERLYLAPDPASRLQLVEHFLLEHVSGNNDPIAQCAALRINASLERFDSKGFAREFGISPRQMNRRFSTAVGLTPKQFARVIRFQRTLEALGSGMRPAEAACDFGYCDQPHMTNEFTRFTGSSPDRFFRRREDTPLMSCFNSSMSRFYNTLYVN